MQFPQPFPLIQVWVLEQPRLDPTKDQERRRGRKRGREGGREEGSEFFNLGLTNENKLYIIWQSRRKLKKLETDSVALCLLPTSDVHRRRQEEAAGLNLSGEKEISFTVRLSYLFSLKVKWCPIFRDGVGRDHLRNQEMDAPESDQESSLLPPASL